MAQITPTEMRTNFPEFVSTGVYPDALLQFWLTVAYTMLNSKVWGSMLDLGAQLYAAHNAVLEAQAKKQAATSQAPGTTVGPANNKSVDKVSVGYDTAAGTKDGDNNWNLTTYGTRFMYYVRLFGAGGIQVNTCGPIYPYAFIPYI